MLVAPGTLPDFTHTLTQDVAQRVASNWWRLLLNGMLLVIAGVLIFSIDWSVRSLSTFIGVLFIVEGVTMSLTIGIDRRVGRANIFSGLLSIAVGIAMIAWPKPGLLAVAIFLGAWLIVVGTLTIVESLAARKLISSWWLWLISGLLEIALGVLALADPGATLAAIVTVGGIWAVAIGVSRIVMSFELKRLPQDVDHAYTQGTNGKSSTGAETGPGHLAATSS
jgi:uncharacterized membrane protein HdeD (DUF308 family)